MAYILSLFAGENLRVENNLHPGSPKNSEEEFK